MAIGRLAIRVHSRTKKHSAAAALAYRCGLDLRDERTGKWHRYGRRDDVIATGITTGSASRPIDAASAGELAKHIEDREHRKDASILRDFQVSLPFELDVTQRAQLTERFSRTVATRYLAIAAYAIHPPGAEGDQRNYHAHIVIPNRDETGAKILVLDDRKTGRDEIKALRSMWESMANAALVAAGHAPTVDMGRKVDRRAVQPTLGQHATRKERAASRKAGNAIAGRSVADLVSDGGAVTNPGKALAQQTRRAKRAAAERAPRRERPPHTPQTPSTAPDVRPSETPASAPQERPRATQSEKDPEDGEARRASANPASAPQETTREPEEPTAPTEADVRTEEAKRQASENMASYRAGLRRKIAAAEEAKAQAQAEAESVKPTDPPAPAPPSPPATPIRGPVEAWAALDGIGPTDAERKTVLEQLNGKQRSFGGPAARSMCDAADAIAKERLTPDIPPAHPSPIADELPCKSENGADSAARVLENRLDAIRAEQPTLERGPAWRITRWAADAAGTVAKMIAAALPFEIRALRDERAELEKPAPDAQRRRARFGIVPRSNEHDRD